MTCMTDVPDPNAIYALYTPGFKPQVVRFALLLDVFSPLARGPLDAEAVACRGGPCTSGTARGYLDCSMRGAR